MNHAAFLVLTSPEGMAAVFAMLAALFLWLLWNMGQDKE